MKTISLAAFVASLTAGVLLLPLSPEVVGYFLFTAALGCIWAQDYSPHRPLRFEVAHRRLGARQVFEHRKTRRAFRAPALAAESHRLAA